MQRITLASICTGLFSLIAGWAMPVMWDHAPAWSGYAGMIVAVGFLVLGAWLQFRPIRQAVAPISLDNAVRYLARDTAWAGRHDTSNPMFSVWVHRALADALESGDLPARGRYFHKLRGGIKDPPMHSRIDIAPINWAAVKWSAWWALNDPRSFNKAEFAEHEGWHDIQVDRARLELLWPRAKRGLLSRWRPL